MIKCIIIMTIIILIALLYVKTIVTSFGTNHTKLTKEEMEYAANDILVNKQALEIMLNEEQVNRVEPER